MTHWTEPFPRPEYLTARSQLTERGPSRFGPIQFFMEWIIPHKTTLVGGFNPFQKYESAKLDHFPRVWGKHIKKNPLSCHHLVTYIKPQGIKPKNSSRVRGFFPAFERVFQAILPAAFQGDFETFHLGVTKVNSPENDDRQPTWVDQPRTDVSG